MSTYEIDREKFGSFVAELRRRQGLTQKQLAEKLYISDKAVSKWETAQSLPDISLLAPLAEALGVTVTELLRGQRAGEDQRMELDEVEQVVAGALGLSAGERQSRAAARRRWIRPFVLCMAAGIGGCMLANWIVRPASPSTEFFLVEGLCLLFGAYACFGMPERLPDYYDQNVITSYSDGIFRINAAGLRFSNANWPYIVRAMRRWLLGAAAVYPCLWLAAHLLLPRTVWQNVWAELALLLPPVLGVFPAILAAGKRHEEK